MTDQNSYDFEDLLKCGHGDLFGPGNARLPLPPMLMFDRIVKITDNGGSHGHGEIVAELDVHPDIWFYRCHFESDPVMPGCLGLDALWQLLGFFLGWIKRPGPGRALSVGEVKFSGEVKPGAKLLRYHLNVKKVIKRAFTLGIADGYAELDGERVYEAKDLRVGLFPDGQKASA